MLQVVREHLLQVQDLGLVVDECQHRDAEGVLHLRVLEELVQDDVRIRVVPKLNDDPHALAVGFIAKVRDALDLLALDKIRDGLDEVCLVDKVGKFRDDDPALAVVHGLDVRHGSRDDLAAAGKICLPRPGKAHDDAACRKVGGLDDVEDLLDVRIPVLIDPVVDHERAGRNHLAEVVRRDIRRHADGDAGRAVNEKVREAGRQDARLLLGVIEVRDEVDGVLSDVRHHLHRDLCQSCLGVSHGRRTVAVHRTEVSVAVHEAVAHAPGLCHVHEGAVDRRIPVGMVLAHRIADDTRALAVRLVRRIAQFAHRPEDTALHGL